MSTVYLIVHLIGIALGAGGAMVSDVMFFKSFRDFTISGTEMDFLKLGSRIVWGGLTLLLISGAFLFFTNPEFYLASPKFLAKMSIVSIIALNGAFFHFVHMPRLAQYADRSFAEDQAFWRGSKPLFISGGLSMVSWIFAITLGAFRALPFSYGEIMAFYGIALFASVTGALVVRHLFMRQAGRASGGRAKIDLL